MKSPKIILVILTTLTISTTSTQGQSPIEIKRLTGPVTFDGMPDEDCWESIEPFPFITLTPVHGQRPTEQTDVRIGYDDEFLYLGAKLLYQDITMMQAVGKKRDYGQMTCDWFGIHLDTYLDKQNAMVFYTNPNGIRFDAAAKRDVKTMEHDINFSWNAFWEVKTSRDDRGWYTEFKIPVSTLRFQEVDGIVRMGLAIVRYIPAKNEMVTFPEIPPEYSMGTWKPSLAHPVEFRSLSPRKPLYISPYVLAGLGQESALIEDGSAYSRTTTPKIDAGLDVKVGLTDNLTMDITLNTDFAQVEADDQQINLTRMSLFFPEKRVFFQEKSDVFDFTMGGSSNLFYSRRIGLYDGNPVRILGGARITGRVGKWDLGIMDLQTANFEDLPSENFGVIRLKRAVLNPGTYLGGIITSRVGMNGSYNVATGIDANIRYAKDDFITFHLARTLENDTDPEADWHDPIRAQVVFERRKEQGFAYDLTLTYDGMNFNPGMGFQSRESYYGVYGMLLYGWLPRESTRLLRHYFKTEWMQWNSMYTKSLETVMVRSGWNFEFRGGLNSEVKHVFAREVLIDSLAIGADQAFIPPDQYDFHYLTTSWMLPPASPVVGMIMTETGAYYDGWRASATLMPTLSVSASFDLTGSYRFDWVTFPHRETGFMNHIIGLKALLTFSTKTSLASFIQYNTAVDQVYANVRFRYNPREGVDFYLVYNEGVNTRPYDPIPHLPISDNRAVMAKFTYTLGR